MQSTFELMFDRVRSIYRAITGMDMPEVEKATTPVPEAISSDTVVRQFADLEALTQSIGALAGRFPPFSFTPPLDIFDMGQELLVEVAVPGIDKEDVRVELSGGQLSISGVRGGASDRVCYHAEIPRGLFSRVIPLPHPVVDKPKVEVVQGVICIHLPKAPKEPAANV